MNNIPISLIYTLCLVHFANAWWHADTQNSERDAM